MTVLRTNRHPAFSPAWVVTLTPPSVWQSIGSARWVGEAFVLAITAGHAPRTLAPSPGVRQTMLPSSRNAEKSEFVALAATNDPNFVMKLGEEQEFATRVYRESLHMWLFLPF
jgi:hypothetical protein